MSAGKKLSPKKAVCKHEGCFESPSTRGFCRTHFLSVLKGKAEGDQKPRALLTPVDEGIVAKKKAVVKDLEIADESTSLAEAFASQGPQRVGELDRELEGEIDEVAIQIDAWKKRFRKAS